MSVLSDTEFLEEMELGNLGIKPFVKKNLTPNGLDLRIGEVYIPELVRKVRSGKVTIPGKARFLISTMEEVVFGPLLVGECWIRTTFARMGFIPAFGKIDAGFRGTLTLSFFNSSHGDIEITIGERIAQLVIQRLGKVPTSMYAEKSGNYQGQKGIVISPDDMKN